MATINKVPATRKDLGMGNSKWGDIIAVLVLILIRFLGIILKGVRPVLMIMCANLVILRSCVTNV